MRLDSHESLPNQPAVEQHSLAGNIRDAGIAVFLLFCAVRVVLCGFGVTLGTSWVDLAYVGVVMALSLVVLARSLPPQNWITIVIVIALFSEAFESAVGTRGSTLQTWGLSLFCVPVLLNARGMAQWLLRPWRSNWAYGFWLVGVTSVLCAGALTSARIITGQNNRILLTFLMRILEAVIVIVVATSFLITKRPVARKLTIEPVVYWLGMNIVLLAAAAISRLPWVVLGLAVVNGFLVWFLSKYAASGKEATAK